MEKQLLMRSHKNDVFRILSKEGLDPFIPNFKWVETGARYFTGKESKLLCNHDGYEFYFNFHFSDKGHCCPIYFPGKTVNVVNIDHSLSWDELKNHIHIWAKRIKLEFEEPDYWKDIAGIQSTFSLDATLLKNDDPISAAEATKLREGITLLHTRLVDEFNLNKEQSKLVLGKLNYLSEAIERQTRTDWVHTATGVFVTVAMTIGVSASNADKFWMLVKESLHKAFQLLIGM